MKKRILITLLILLSFSDLTMAEPAQKEESTQNKQAETTTTSTYQAPNNQLELKPEYTSIQNKNLTIFYDKTGKIIAKNKILKSGTFFYNNTGQLIGKSNTIADKTYYYNSIGTFLGICDKNGDCQDKNYVSTGKIPPLPKIKNSIPYIDMTTINNVSNKKTSEDE